MSNQQLPRYILDRATRLMCAAESVVHLSEIAEELMEQAELHKEDAEILRKHIGYLLNAIKQLGEYAKLDGIKLFGELRLEWPGNGTQP